MIALVARTSRGSVTADIERPPLTLTCRSRVQFGGRRYLNVTPALMMSRVEAGLAGRSSTGVPRLS